MFPLLFVNLNLQGKQQRSTPDCLSSQPKSVGRVPGSAYPGECPMA